MKEHRAAKQNNWMMLIIAFLVIAINAGAIDSPQIKEGKMSINEKAQKNISALFPEYQSPLMDTDPELYELFNNFAFDEALNNQELDKQNVMMILGSMIACQSVEEYKIMLKGALNIGVTPVELKEMVYHAIPYIGYAKTSPFIAATNDVFKDMEIELPVEGQSTTNPENRFDKGIAVQKEIFGEIIDTLHENAPADLKHIQNFLSDNCFGDFYTRTGLDLQTRELLTFTLLISLGGCESQVRSHIAGNLSVGNTRQTLLNTVTVLVPYIGYPRSLNAIAAINEITAKK